VHCKIILDNTIVPMVCSGYKISDQLIFNHLTPGVTMTQKPTKEKPQVLQDRAKQIDIIFMSNISQLATKHNMTADINLQTRQINLIGGSDHDQQAIAQDIDHYYQDLAI